MSRGKKFPPNGKEQKTTMINHYSAAAYGCHKITRFHSTLCESMEEACSRWNKSLSTRKLTLIRVKNYLQNIRSKVRNLDDEKLPTSAPLLQAIK
jgi:hypothetical protein